MLSQWTSASRHVLMLQLCHGPPALPPPPLLPFSSFLFYFPPPLQSYSHPFFLCYLSSPWLTPHINSCNKHKSCILSGKFKCFWINLIFWLWSLLRLVWARASFSLTVIFHQTLKEASESVGGVRQKKKKNICNSQMEFLPSSARRPIATRRGG